MSRRWDPSAYLDYAGERLRPALDLLARIPARTPRRVVDLGCGPGNVTRLLAERWPDAEICGVDSSPEMIESARRLDVPIRWIEASIADWVPEQPVDVMFSNAALHWLADHRTLVPRLFGCLAAGGTLAVQMPNSWSQPSHALLREALEDGGPGGTPLGPPSLRAKLAARSVESASAYWSMLSPLAAGVDVWETQYLHALSGEDPVLAWVRSTTLRPVLDTLESGERDAFLAKYRERLRVAYPRGEDGVTLFPFRRLFVVAEARG